LVFIENNDLSALYNSTLAFLGKEAIEITHVIQLFLNFSSYLAKNIFLGSPWDTHNL